MKTIPNFSTVADDLDYEGAFYRRIRPQLIAIAVTFRRPDLVDDIVSYMAEKLWQSGKPQAGYWLYRRAVDFMRKESPAGDQRRAQVVGKESLDYLVYCGWQFDERGNIYEPEKGETG